MDDAVYISVENYPDQVVPDKCLSNTYAAIVTLSVVHNSLTYSKSWYD